MSAVMADGGAGEPPRHAVEQYYDQRVAEKLRDFTEALPRIEAAVATIAEWAPAAPRRVLEIGCGVGATSWRMARAWTGAEVIGVDLSPASIAAANSCFRRPNLDYRAGRLSECALAGQFDLIVMMDVYEHIARSERRSLHAALRDLLSAESRLLLMVPTPAHQAYLRANLPQSLQPVDEDIGPAEIVSLAAEVGARLLSYREIGIWHYGDYAHAVLGRTQALPQVAARRSVAATARQVARRLLGREAPKPQGLTNYLGADRLGAGAQPGRFDVPRSERERLAAAWAERSRSGPT
jgi:trans-aconitate methyltransferase